MRTSGDLDRARPGFAGRRLIGGLVLWLSLSGARSEELSAGFEGFFESHCVDCHDADTQKGKLDLSSLAWDAGDPQIFESWVRVFDKVDREEMPPPEEKHHPTAEARERFLRMLRGELRAASHSRQQSEGRVVLRRLNRVEYENTLHDLLSIDLPLQHYLPEDAVSHGFDNVAEGLRLSMLHLEKFLEAADAAIDAAIDLGREPEHVSRRFRYQDEESVIEDQKKPPETSGDRFACCLMRW